MLGNKVLILLVVAVTSSSLISESFADGILVEFDKSEYDTGDELTLSGYLVEFSMPVVAVSVYDPEGKILSANNLEIDEDGMFSKTISLDSPFYDKPGEYKIKIDYQKISQEEYFIISGEPSIPNPILDEKIQPEIVLLFTDKAVYADGDTVKINGIVSSLASSTVLIGIYDPFGTPAGFYFGNVDENLEFSTSFLIKAGVNFKIDGLYSIKAHYAETEYTTTFEFYENNSTPDDTTPDDTTPDDTTPDDTTPDDTTTDDTTTDDDNKTKKENDSIIKNQPTTNTKSPKDNSVIKTSDTTEDKKSKSPNLETERKTKTDNLSVEDIELGKLLNQINLDCDKSKYSDTISYYDGMGPALYRLCKFDSSLQVFTDSLSKDPNNVEILTNKGSALGKLGYLDEAIYHYDKAISIDHNFLPAINNKANILAKMGDHEEAISHYAKALAINPNYSTARQNLELVLSEMPNEEVVFTQPVALEEKNPIKEKPVQIQEPTKITNEKYPNILEQLGTMFSSLGNMLGISN